jgi:hypothetical protein
MYSRTGVQFPTLVSNSPCLQPSCYVHQPKLFGGRTARLSEDFNPKLLNVIGNEQQRNSTEKMPESVKLKKVFLFLM